MRAVVVSQRPLLCGLPPEMWACLPPLAGCFLNPRPRVYYNSVVLLLLLYFIVVLMLFQYVMMSCATLSDVL